MIRITDHRQQDLFDPWDFLSPKRRELLEQSWAALFQKELLCELPVGEVASFFDDDFGRPTKELHTVLGTLLLQQVRDLTDEEIVSQLAFNIEWHYALNITDESDSAKYMCPKTLWNMRSIFVENGLDAMIFDRTTNKLQRFLRAIRTTNGLVLFILNPICVGIALSLLFAFSFFGRKRKYQIVSRKLPYPVNPVDPV